MFGLWKLVNESFYNLLGFVKTSDGSHYSNETKSQFLFFFVYFSLTRIKRGSMSAACHKRHKSLGWRGSQEAATGCDHYGVMCDADRVPVVLQQYTGKSALKLCSQSLFA